MPKINDMDIDQYLYESVHVRDDSIQEEYACAAPAVAYWGAQYAAAAQEALEAETRRKQTKARLFIEKKKGLEALESKVTEKLIESHVDMDPAMQVAIAEEHRTEGNRLKMLAFFEAVKTKREMLISLGATQRKEMEGDPVIRQRAAQRRAQREGDEG